MLPFHKSIFNDFDFRILNLEFSAHDIGSIFSTIESALVTRLPWSITLSGFITLLATGALFASLGTFFPYLQQRFNLKESEVGILITMVSIGSILGSFMMGYIATAFQTRSKFILGCLLTLVGLLGFVFFPNWPLMLISGLINGVGTAILTVEVNSSFAKGFGTRSAAMTTLVGATFSFGAILGPLIVSLNPYQPSYLFYSVASMIFAVLLIHVFSPSISLKPQAQILSGKTSKRLFAWFILLFLTQTSIEVVIGSWAPTHLIRLGQSPETASRMLSAFWIAATLGRFLTVPLSLRIQAPILIASSFTLTFILSILAITTNFTAVAYILMGVAAGPLFPMLIAWINQRLPHAQGATAYALSGASVGAAILPPLSGKIIELSSVSSIPIIILVLTVLGICTTLSIGFGNIVKKPA